MWGSFTGASFFEKYQFENSFNLVVCDRFVFPYRGTFNIPGFGSLYKCSKLLGWCCGSNGQ
jgi:hypothetical protein